MSLVNIERITQNCKENQLWNGMYLEMQKDVKAFYESFHDDPSYISGWGHNYFCKEDGSALIYNPLNKKEHKCPVCNRVYNDRIFEEVWVYKYRNEAILTTYKAAVLYALTKDKYYIKVFQDITSFYMDKYDEFPLHDKMGVTYESLDTMAWGCGKIMAQGLNEAIIMIRLFAGASIIEPYLDKGFIKKIRLEFIPKVYTLLKPQVDQIHNISCWVNSAIGIMGLFSGNQEMVDFAFRGDLNIRRQLREGVTEDRFWYEGSIHYNFFTLEGVAYLALFCKNYDYDFGSELSIVEEMFLSAYDYAFTNDALPNPNDGWPNLNLKTYSYIYSIGTKVFGYDGYVADVFRNILQKENIRGTLPLSKPYYYNNELSLEQFVYLSDFDVNATAKEIRKVSKNFEKSNFTLAIRKDMDLFFKYGHNTASHAHPDKMTIEWLVDGKVITKDLSNAGYGSKICQQWHQMSASHNTVVVNGTNHESTGEGKLVAFDERLKETTIHAVANNIYHETNSGVNFSRELKMIDKGLIDNFVVHTEEESVLDYFMHFSGEFQCAVHKNTDKCERRDEKNYTDLGYHENGYQHLEQIQYLGSTNEGPMTLVFKVKDMIVESFIEEPDTDVYISKSPDNPITDFRSTLILRQKGKEGSFKVFYSI